MTAFSRLFFALWPDDETRNQLALTGRCSGIDARRRVPEENLHVTLAFLGNVDEAQQRQLQDGAAGLSAGRFTLDINLAGWWRRPGLVWLGPDQVPAELARLHAGLRGLARECSLPVDSRPYRPHITLAKKVNTDPGLEFEPIRWNVRDFCLVESRTLPAGAEYQIIQRWPLT